jgi:hypothetical protein
VPARVALDQREVQRVGVQAADRGEAALERLGRKRGAVGLGLGEVLGEVIAPHGPWHEVPSRALSSVSAGVSVAVPAHRVVRGGDQAVQFACEVGGLLVESA